MLHGVTNQIRTTFQSELLHGPRPVRLHRLHAEIEPARDFLVAVAGSRQAAHLDFTITQRGVLRLFLRNTPPDESVDHFAGHRRIEINSAPRDVPDGVNEFLGRSPLQHVSGRPPPSN